MSFAAIVTIGAFGRIVPRDVAGRTRVAGFPSGAVYPISRFFATGIGGSFGGGSGPRVACVQ
jgi:hypothetical protein